MKHIPLFFIYAYRAVFSASSGRQCRFEPTCSKYAEEAFKKHRFRYAFILTVKRLWRCSPCSPYRGDWHHDPVPETRKCCDEAY